MQHLETLVRHMAHSHRNDLKVRRKKISIYPRIGHSRKLSSNNAPMAMGKFYEFLSQAFYGGKLEEEIEITDGNGDETTTRPDIINVDENIIYEVKASQRARGFLLQDRQIEFYRSMQANFLSDETEYPRIYFLLYVHSFEGVKSHWKGNTDEMYNALCAKTLCSIVIPFNIILELYNPSKGTNDLVYRYDNESKYDVGTKVRSGTLVRLFKEPKKVIKELCLDPNDYSITRSRVPRGMHIISDRCKRIKQFPVVRIDYKHHNQWSEAFVKTYLGDVPF
ncbi:hypothetical protein HYU23_04015 [Candidatus Woesearchaeota archaeon]|nr:hypothetical protein [Candidatus Woesearchaeota archaeon]